MKIQRIARGTAPNLPDEIIEYILLWLPVPSLLKFKCVCKYWRCLISSQSFIEYHLRKNGNKRIIFKNSGFKPTLHYCSFNSLLPGSVVTYAHFGFPIETLGSKDIVGSVDGLLCILLNLTSFFLWNPSTRKFKVLPKIDRICPLLPCGFGFDESSRDYKVVASCDSANKIMKVYSLKSNSWKSVEAYAGCLPKSIGCFGKFADGKLHWVPAARPCDRIEIISFDLTKEVWENMYVPNYCWEEFFSCVGGGVGFASHLSVQCANLKGIGIDVYKRCRPTLTGTVSCIGPNDIILFLQKKSSSYVVKGNFSKDGGRRMIKADDHSKRAYIAEKNIKEAYIHRESLVEIL